MNKRCTLNTSAHNTAMCRKMCELGTIIGVVVSCSLMFHGWGVKEETKLVMTLKPFVPNAQVEEYSGQRKYDTTLLH